MSLFRPTFSLLATVHAHKPLQVVSSLKDGTIHESHSQQLRAEVLKLYRSIIRCLTGAPKTKAREDAYVYARGEFERNRNVTNAV
jgi:hypothetical protein